MVKIQKFNEKTDKHITQLDHLTLDVSLDNPESLNGINGLSIRTVESYKYFKQFNNFKKIGYLCYKGVEMAKIGWYSIYGFQNSKYNMKIEFTTCSLYNGSCFECIQILEKYSKWERRVNTFHIAFDYNGFSYINWWHNIYEDSEYFKNGQKKKFPITLHNRTDTLEEIRKKKKSPTIYLGEIGSAKRLRIYNKTKELIEKKDLVKESYMKSYYKKNGIDCSNVERLELELRKGAAHKYKLQDLFNSSFLNQILHDELLGKKNEKGEYVHSFLRFTKTEKRNAKYRIIDCTPIRFDRLPKKEVKHIPPTYKRATGRQREIRKLRYIYEDVYVNKNKMAEGYLMCLLEDYSLREYFNKKCGIWEKEWDSEPRHEAAVI